MTGRIATGRYRLARGFAAIGLVALGIACLAACGAPSPTPAGVLSPGPTPAGPPQTVPPVTAVPDSPGASASAGASASTPAAGDTVVRDDTLLAILPPDIDGAPVTIEDASFDEAATDRAFATNVARAAFAIVSAPNDLASGVVAELRPGTWSDTFFQDWRETYNEGACAQAGGVGTNAETQLDGRTVYITTCGGGLTVYHVYLEERDVIVSLFSLGEGRFGERLVGDLRP